jgi:NAD(P)-dependent dehydrogenase (short-subunit alcohol dehydrogenase family)
MSILLITGANKGLGREAARRLLEDARMTHAFLPLLERLGQCSHRECVERPW